MDNNLNIKKELLQTIEDFKSIDNGNQNLTQFINENLLIFNKRNYMLYVETIDGKINVYAYKFIFDGENLKYSNSIDVNALLFPVVIAEDQIDDIKKSLQLLVSIFNSYAKKVFVDIELPFIADSYNNILSKDHHTLINIAYSRKNINNINFNSIVYASECSMQNLSSIDDYIFNSMTQLQKIYNDAFYNCNSLANISCDNSLSYIGTHAFSKSSVKTVDLSKSRLSIINHKSFKNCVALTSINLPSTLYYIGYNAFNNCSNLQQINVLSGIEHLAIDHSFDGCSNLLSIVVNGYNIKDYVLSSESQFYFDANDNYKMMIIR